MVKYHFAKNEAGEIVDIDDVTKEYRAVHSFCCLGCGTTMNARLGESNAHHFYHSDGADCGYGESDLHRYAKKVLKKKFENNSTFPVRLVQDVSCGTKCLFDNNCHAKQLKEYDLKAFGYDTIEEEKEIEGGFVADLLISDSTGKNPVILLEIYVTHPIGETKEQSGKRIIEIPIKNDEDVRFFQTNPISEAEPNSYNAQSRARSPRFFGFRRDSQSKDSIGVRDLPVASMFVDYSIECTEIEENILCSEIKTLSCKPDELIKVVFDGDIMHSYRTRLGNFVRMVAVKNGIPVRNCKICNNGVPRFTRDYDRPIKCLMADEYGLDLFPVHWAGVECPYFKLSARTIEKFEKEEYAADKYVPIMNWPKGQISYDCFRTALSFVKQEGFVNILGQVDLRWVSSRGCQSVFQASVFEPGQHIPEEYVVVEGGTARWAEQEEINSFANSMIW